MGPPLPPSLVPSEIPSRDPGTRPVALGFLLSVCVESEDDSSQRLRPILLALSFWEEELLNPSTQRVQLGRAPEHPSPAPVSVPSPLVPVFGLTLSKQCSTGTRQRERPGCHICWAWWIRACPVHFEAEPEAAFGPRSCGLRKPCVCLVYPSASVPDSPGTSRVPRTVPLHVFPVASPPSNRGIVIPICCGNGGSEM